MKFLAGLGLTALMVVGNASATTIGVFGTATAGNLNESYNAQVTGNSSSGTITFAAQNFGVLTTITGVTLIYETDYSSPDNTSGGLQITSTFVPNGAGMVSDTLTTTFLTQSTESYTNATPPGLTFVNQGTDSNGSTIIGGFNQAVTAGVPVAAQYGSFTVNWTSTVTEGTAQSASVNAEIVYTYSTSSAGGTPEPVSMILFGSGLLAVSLIGRKKFFARK
jgi:hypothetical protein